MLLKKPIFGKCTAANHNKRQ